MRCCSARQRPGRTLYLPPFSKAQIQSSIRSAPGLSGQKVGAEAYLLRLRTAPALLYASGKPRHRMSTECYSATRTSWFWLRLLSRYSLPALAL